MLLWHHFFSLSGIYSESINAQYVSTIILPIIFEHSGSPSVTEVDPDPDS